ncbi:dienelactone hydrolase [Schizophyllum amplum]|uniref:Dienelactone hydrolase n=1 Tax=Schizophyllum amplum TaxID=97359 RepID=A0A550CHC8_9AGAR|nr:dienelactone hydrolase [Auriculariopsis ampla]
MSLCDDCFRGVRWTGTPSGTIEKINEVECYVATPEGAYAPDKVLLFLPDVFGMQALNNQLLADDFAANGFKTVIPDFLNGDPAPADALDPGSTWNSTAWRPKHGAEQTRPTLDRVVEGLRRQGVTAFGATGYCFGARYVFDLAFDGVLRAAAVAHPSLLKIPDDAEQFARTSVPLLVESCEVDRSFSAEAAAAMDVIMEGVTTVVEGKQEPLSYKRTHWAGCKHGFAVRGDPEDPNARAAKEGAFKDTVEWMKQWLRA